MAKAKTAAARDTMAPSSVTDLFDLHKRVLDVQDFLNNETWPDAVKGPVMGTIGQRVTQVEQAIVAELTAQQQQGKMPPGGLKYGEINYTLQNGQLITEEIPDSSTLTLLIPDPFGGAPQPTVPTGTGGDTTTGGTGTDTTATGTGTDTATGTTGTDTTTAGTGTDTTGGGTGPAPVAPVT